MRVFEHPNMSAGWKCKICNTARDEPVVLVGIPGTEEDGIVECDQVHYDCYNTIYKIPKILRDCGYMKR